MPRGLAKPSVAQATLDLLGSDFVEDVSRYIVPIFADINGAPVSMGTGFLLNTGQDHVLITAAHVLDRLTSLPHYFYVEQLECRCVVRFWPQADVVYPQFVALLRRALGARLLQETG